MNEQLKEKINNSQHIVFYCGNQLDEYSGFILKNCVLEVYEGKSASELLTRETLRNSGNLYYDYIRACSFPNLQVSEIHRTIASLQKKKDVTVIDEGITGLFKKAGIINYIALCGSIYEYTCDSCNQNYPLEAVLNSAGIPKCKCGDVLQPTLLLAGQAVNGSRIGEALNAIQLADLLVICGSTMRLPAARYLMQFYEGDCVVVNNSNSDIDNQADLLLIGDLNENMV